MRSLNRTILRVRLFFSTFRQRKKFKGSSFIYELKDDNFKNLSDEEKGKAIQRDWNRYMEDN
jgi:hypothetical protein